MQSLGTRFLLALALAVALPGLAWAHEEISAGQDTGLVGFQETGVQVTSSGEVLVISLGEFEISLSGSAAQPAVLRIEAEADEGAVELEIELEAPEPVAPPQEGPAPAQADEEDEPDEIHFQGVLESIQGNVWVIGGRSFVVNAATELDEGLEPGVLARVEAVLGADGVTFIATEIETDADDEDEDDDEDNSGPGSHSSGPGGGHHDDDEDDDEADEDD